MSAARIGGCTLTFGLATWLAPRIRHSDVLDCAAHAYDPLEALLIGLEPGGRSWAATWQDIPIGAFGWTQEGRIWSLWTELTTEQSRAIMSRTPALIRSMKRDARQTLSNVVRCENRLTIAWLKATKCFNLGWDKIVHDEAEGVNYLPFWTKEDL